LLRNHNGGEEREERKGKNIWRFLESIRLSILAGQAESKENYKRE
jgi:hypothetical protein